MKFSKEEIRDIAIAIAALGIILIIEPFPNLGINLSVIPGYLVGISLGFVLHELAHKGMANQVGAEAFFKLWPQGVLIGLLFSIISPLKFLAPGAVVIFGYKFGRWKFRLDRLMTTSHGPALSRGETGLISVVGPLVNVVLAYVFWALPGEIFQQISFVNAFMAVFNLVPIPPLDGSKIMLWNAVIWLFVLIVAAVPLAAFLL